MTLSKIQIGKKGVTENFVSTLKTYFKNNNVVKISVLKSARESREKTKEYADELLEKLGVNFTSRVIGHTIALKKWRRAQR
jgi:RNA-binding protein YhbY